MKVHDDLYVILDLEREASHREVERAFRRLARLHHPDINPGDGGAEARFNRIAQAYQVLSDPPQRRFYDENGYYVAEAPEHRNAGFAFQGIDLSQPRNAERIEPLSAFFRSGAAGEPERGEDIEHPISIGFAESMRGLTARIAVERHETCIPCRGTGHATTDAPVSCPACGGRGRAPRNTGRLQFSAPCTACGGTGAYTEPCAACGGQGRRPALRDLEIGIPVGVQSQTRLTFQGRGHAGRRGGAPGDLHIAVNVAPHPLLNRAGDNIYCTVPIAFWEAALGAKIDVPTIDGTATVRIPPGTQNGQKLRLRGKGAPSLAQPGSRGDQFVTVQVVVPRIADERSKSILRELAQLNPDDPRRGLFA
jgi:molecular chaperone DnaJ